MTVAFEQLSLFVLFIVQFGAYFGHSVAAVDLNGDG